MSTVVNSKYEDTNKVFEWPHWTEYDFDIHEWDDDDPVDVCWNIGQRIWEDEMPTVQMLGRWQPWHEWTPSTTRKMYGESSASRDNDKNNALG